MDIKDEAMMATKIKDLSYLGPVLVYGPNTLSDRLAGANVNHIIIDK